MIDYLEQIQLTFRVNQNIFSHLFQTSFKVFLHLYIAW